MSNTVIMLCVKIFSPNRFHMKCGMSTFKMHIIYNYNSVTSELFPSMWNGKKNKLWQLLMTHFWWEVQRSLISLSRKCHLKQVLEWTFKVPLTWEVSAAIKHVHTDSLKYILNSISAQANFFYITHKLPQTPTYTFTSTQLCRSNKGHFILSFQTIRHSLSHLCSQLYQRCSLQAFR